MDPQKQQEFPQHESEEDAELNKEGINLIDPNPLEIEVVEPHSIDHILSSIGLRFQLLVYLTIVCGMVSGAFILYSLYYFQL